MDLRRDRPGVRAGPGRARSAGLPGAGRRGQRRSACRSSAPRRAGGPAPARRAAAAGARRCPTRPAVSRRAALDTGEAETGQCAVPVSGRTSSPTAGSPRSTRWSSGGSRAWDEAAFAALRGRGAPGSTGDPPGGGRGGPRARRVAGRGSGADRQRRHGAAAGGHRHAHAGGPAGPAGFRRRQRRRPARSLVAISRRSRCDARSSEAPWRRTGLRWTGSAAAGGLSEPGRRIARGAGADAAGPGCAGCWRSSASVCGPSSSGPPSQYPTHESGKPWTPPDRSRAVRVGVERPACMHTASNTASPEQRPRGARRRADAEQPVEPHLAGASLGVPLTRCRCPSSDGRSGLRPRHRRRGPCC